MAGYPDEVKQVFVDWKQEKLLKELEDDINELQKRRIEYVEYGDPKKLTPKKRAALNAELLRQALLHRAESLLQAAGKMLLAKNVYGLALVARGFVEATAVLGYFCKRIDSLAKGNIDFEKFETDIANGLLGAKDDLFSQADAPVGVLTKDRSIHKNQAAPPTAIEMPAAITKIGSSRGLSISGQIPIAVKAAP